MARLPRCVDGCPLSTSDLSRRTQQKTSDFNFLQLPISHFFDRTCFSGKPNPSSPRQACVRRRGEESKLRGTRMRWALRPWRNGPRLPSS